MFAANRIQKILSMIAKLNENELDELMSKLNLDDNEPADGENSETETMSEESEGNDNTETTTEETAETEETETEAEAEEQQSEEAPETTVDDETGVEETATETENTENSENDTMREMIAQMVNEAVAKAMEEFKSNDSRKSKEAGEEEAKALNKLESIYN